MLKLAGELLEGQLAEHIACLDAHIRNPREVFRTGEYMLPLILSFYSLSQTTMTANKLYAVPFLAARDMTVDRIATYVAGIDAGKNARLGIYENGTNLYPGALLLDAGEINVGTGTGAKVITISQSLVKNIYWLAIVSDGTPIIRVAANAQTILGVNSNQTATQTGWIADHTYAALPDPYPAEGSFIETSMCFVLSLRLASLD